MLAEAPWSTIGVEQVHGSMAVQHRQHQHITAMRLSTRAFLHSIRTYVSQSPAEQILARKDKRLARAVAKNPATVGGFSAFMSDMFALARQAQPGKPLAHQQFLDIGKMAQERWAEVTLQVKEEYRSIAHQRALAKLAEKEEAVAEIQCEIRLFEQRQRDEELEGGEMYRAAFHRFPREELGELARKFEQSSVSRKTTHELFGKRQSSPDVPDIVHQQAVIDAIPSNTPIISERGQITDFARTLSNHRDIFRNVIIVLENDIKNHGYLLLFSTKSPIRSYFAILEPELPATIPHLRSMTFKQQEKALRGHLEWCYKIRRGEFCADTYLERHDPALPKWVIPMVTWPGDGVVGSDAVAIPWEIFIHGVFCYHRNKNKKFQILQF